MKKWFNLAITIILVVSMTACCKKEEKTIEKKTEDKQTEITREAEKKKKNEEDIKEKPAVAKDNMKEENQLTAEQNKRIVIDPGHQKKADNTKEPIGPGSFQKKAKVTGGTAGVVSGLAEYELVLTVSLKLKEKLISRGYDVIMCRETHDVNISNSERAKIANDNHADAFVRIHANGSDNPSTHGMLTICQTARNPYNKELYKESKLLSQYILDEMVRETKAKKLNVWETDTMSGINWSQVPVSIIEMGYMTNKEEDALMKTDEYQDKIAEGIANGIELFLNNKNQ